jgi:cation transport regulator ChaC
MRLRGLLSSLGSTRMTRPMTDNDPHYFGYGTLLGIEEMRRYCPSAEKVGVASYADHALEFWAYPSKPERVGCHLVEAWGVDAYGVVYRVPTEELAYLDRAAGVATGVYRRRPIEVTMRGGKRVIATTYFLVAPTRRAIPNPVYADLVRAGLRTETELPRDFVRRLAAYLDSFPAESEREDAS